MISMRRCNDAAADLAILQSILARAPRYFVLERGHPAPPGEAQQMIHEHPPGLTPADKDILLAFDDDVPVGCVDIAFGWPKPDTAVIGLLLVAEDHQQRGVGRSLYALVEASLRPRFRTVRIGVLAKNAGALAFWNAVGFVATGERKPHQRGNVVDDIVVFEKRLS
jgi:ribosomal protein S18 acetylase RimI-like enzyme